MACHLQVTKNISAPTRTCANAELQSRNIHYV